jgi:hypothetical protein
MTDAAPDVHRGTRECGGVASLRRQTTATHIMRQLKFREWDSSAERMYFGGLELLFNKGRAKHKASLMADTTKR